MSRLHVTIGERHQAVTRHGVSDALTRLVGHVTLTAIVCVMALMVWAYAHPTNSAGRASRTWLPASMSHYGTTGDGYLGGRTSCGKTVRADSRFVAALSPRFAHCGMKVTLRYHGRRYLVTVQDRGAWRSDDRYFDAAPGLRRLLGFDSIAHVQWRKGWQ